MKSKFTLLVFASALFTSSVFAFADPSVKITSFLFIGDRSYAAEICGVVNGLDGTAGLPIVTLLIDDGTKHPGHYHVIAGSDGLFCSTVATYYGTATASVTVAGKTIQTTASASKFQ